MPKEIGYVRVIQKKAVGLRREDSEFFTAALAPAEPEYVLSTLGSAGWKLSPDSPTATTSGDDFELKIERDVPGDQPFVPEGPFTNAQFEWLHVVVPDGQSLETKQHEYERNGWDLIAVVRTFDDSARYLQFRRPLR